MLVILPRFVGSTLFRNGGTVCMCAVLHGGTCGGGGLLCKLRTTSFFCMKLVWSIMLPLSYLLPYHHTTSVFLNCLHRYPFTIDRIAIHPQDITSSLHLQHAKILHQLLSVNVDILKVDQGLPFPKSLYLSLMLIWLLLLW